MMRIPPSRLWNALTPPASPAGTDPPTRLKQGPEQVPSAVQNGVELSEFTRSLETELLQAGIDPAALDRESLYRALLMHRFGIPFDRAAINGSLDELPAVLRTTTELLKEAGALLSQANLSADERLLVETLTGDLRASFSGLDSGKDVHLLLTDMLSLWTCDTETAIRALPIPDTAGITQVLRAFHEMVSRLDERISPLDFSNPGARLILENAVSELDAGVNQLAGLVLGAYGTGQEDARLALDGLFRKQALRLRSLLFADTGESPGGVGIEQVFRTAAQMHRSGMLFEWRLLAWYRAGHDPESLRQLMHRDTKGILLGFTGKVRQSGGSVPDASVLDPLALKAGALLDRLTALQIALLPARGYDGEPEHRNMPQKEKPAVENAPGDFAGTFSVQTANLGTVSASIQVHGRAVAVSLTVERESGVPLAGRFADDLKDRLRNRGFSAGPVRVVHVKKACT